MALAQETCPPAEPKGMFSPATLRNYKLPEQESWNTRQKMSSSIKGFGHSLRDKQTH